MWKIIVATCGLLLATVSSAQETPRFHVGLTIKVGGTILCDTAEQLSSILAAHQINWDAGMAKLRELNAVRNDIGEPVCVLISSYSSAVVTFVAEVAHFDNIVLPNGEVKTFYVAAVYYQRQDGSSVPGFIISAYPIHGGPEPASFSL